MAGSYQGYQYQPDHCWALERVPWWEPPYLLHNGRLEVRLGRREGNTKVCQGHQVSRNHVLFVRTGTPEDWQAVRWSVVDQGGVCGTYVNQTRIGPHTPYPLNADDLIGLGSGEGASVRLGGKETFVYRIRAPRAFQQMDAEADQIDLLDGDAPTPPPADMEENEDSAVVLPDIVRAVPITRPADHPLPCLPNNPATQQVTAVTAALPSTSSRPSSPSSKPGTSSKQSSLSLTQSTTSPGQICPRPGPVLPPVQPGTVKVQSSSPKLPGVRFPPVLASARQSGRGRQPNRGNVNTSHPDTDTSNIGRESKSKSGHKLEVITLDSSDEELADVKKTVQSDAESINSNVDSSSILKLDCKRKRKDDGGKTKSKKLKQIFGSDSEKEDNVGAESQETSTSGLSGSFAITESLLAASHLAEQFSPISSDDDLFSSPAKSKLVLSPRPVDLSKGRLKGNNKKTLHLSQNNKKLARSLLPEDHRLVPVKKVELSNLTPTPSLILEKPTTVSIKKVDLPNSTPTPPSIPEEPKPVNVKKVELSVSTSSSLPEQQPSLLLPSPNTELIRLAEKIKAARLNKRSSHPTITNIKLEFPVRQIKKELPDTDLPPITVTGGYSQEPEVITICDSEEEEDYDAKHSQAVASGEEVDDSDRDSIKEEVMSDPEEFQCNDFEDAEDEEEIQILQSSENKLFAAISKRIKVEFDETCEQASLEVEETPEDLKEKEMIMNLMEAVGCDEDMAICAIAQAKEIYDCEDPTFEQIVQVITGEEDDNSSSEDELIENKAAEIQPHDSIAPDSSNLFESDMKRPSSACSNTSRDSVDDLLEGLEDNEPARESKISPKAKSYSTTGKFKSNSGSKENTSKKRLSNEQLKNLFEDDMDTAESNLSFKPSLSSPVKGKTSGPRLIEPMAMPKRRGLAQKSPVSSNDWERNKILETLQKSRPKPVGKPLFKKRNLSESKDQIAFERKQKLAEIAAKNRKAEIVKEITAPVGIMKMSNPKSQNLLLEMSSCNSMQPKRKVTKPKIEIKRPRLVKYFENNKVPPLLKIPLKENNLLADTSEMIKTDQVKLDEDKKKMFAETSDGYIVPKKMSVSNIEYNTRTDTAEQRADVTGTKQSGQAGSILRKKGKGSVIKKSVQWRDQNGFHCLVEVREIPAENTGVKCSSKNNKDGCVKVHESNELIGPKVIKKDVLMDDIFRSILNWNTAWLEEQKKMTEPPPVHQPWQLIPVTNTFSNWEEYRKIFLPLMLQEMWSSISREYEEKKNCREDIVPVCLQEVSQDPKGQFLVVRCVGLLTEQEVRRDCGCEGTLVQLNISFNLGSAAVGSKQAREIKPCFGFVQNIKRVPFRKDCGNFGEFDSERIKRLQTLAVKNKNRKGILNNLVYYTMRVKLNLVPAGRKLSSDKPIYMKALSRIRPEMRKFEAILDLPQSRLFDSIVSPQKETLQVPTGGQNLHATIQGIPQMAQLNQCQKQIIVSVSQACVLQPEVAKICLVQGPPGTGKSSTISGLILQILYSKMEHGKVESMPRILVVAPSNAAVDELALKLISLKSQLSEQIRFRILRLGVQQSMHHQVRNYSYDAQIGQYIAAQTRQAKATESLEKDERNKQAAANQIYAEKLKAEAEGKEDLASKLNRDYREKVQQIEKIKSELRKPLDTRSRKDLERIAGERTMAGADIILATLSSSLSVQMDRFFVQGVGTSKVVGSLRPMSVCIMDEASQCVEPEALIPLKLGFCKLVMVGDHEQLPATVTSRKAQQLDYQQSLFGRLFSYFTGISGDGGANCPVLRLYTQYRMHKDIANWPSRYFYGGKLTQGQQERGSSLAPYSVIQVLGEARQQGGHCWNKEEEKVVIATIQAIKAIVGDKLSIGVITFYAKQKQNISLEVQNKRLTNIVVNTVDGFQGSERDVIIISCVRGGVGGIGFLQDRQRLNVALTRARYSLVVVGNMETLRSASDMWSELVTNAEIRNTFFKVEKDSVNQEQMRNMMGRTKAGQS